MKNTMKNLVKNILTKAMLTMGAVLVIGAMTGTESEAAGSKKADPRKANYEATNPDYKTIEYTWTEVDGSTSSFSYSIDQSAYEYYSSLDRYVQHSDWNNYITDLYNHAIIEQIVDIFEAEQEKNGYSDAMMIWKMTEFVQQSITYQTDLEGTGKKEHPKYPIETLFSKAGDCEDTSILLAALIDEAGYGSCLLIYDNHAAVGLLGGDFNQPYYDTERGHYYYVETTCTGWFLGVMPKEYQSKPATIYFV